MESGSEEDAEYEDAEEDEAAIGSRKERKNNREEGVNV